MKKILSFLILIFLCSFMCLTFAGCTLWAKSLKLPWYESGDYKYAVNTLKDGTKEAYLIGLTEQGSNQKYLILPSEIDGIPVKQMGYYQSTGITSVPIPSSGTNNEPSECKAERLYITEANLSLLGSEDQKSIFKNYPKQSVFQFFSKSLFETEVFSWLYENSIVPHKNLLSEDLGELNRHSIVKTWQLNNVSYMYNYADAPEEGYYWIDSWDNTLIDFIPPEPTREGYSFDGWYKDKECTDIWDFDVYKTGNIIKYDESGNIDTSSEIFLYAKWI